MPAAIKEVRLYKCTFPKVSAAISIACSLTSRIETLNTDIGKDLSFSVATSFCSLGQVI